MIDTRLASAIVVLCWLASAAWCEWRQPQSPLILILFVVLAAFSWVGHDKIPTPRLSFGQLPMLVVLPVGLSALAVMATLQPEGRHFTGWMLFAAAYVSAGRIKDLYGPEAAASASEKGRER